ncbi:MAG: OmpA family protein [Deltaproteobacteria bacterium]|nr:OmpA family protein [Deltaproteobacteria bacterium]
MARPLAIFLCCLSLLLFLGIPNARCQGQISPLEFLKAQELRNRDAPGEVYLGNVMSLSYPPNAVAPAEKYYPFLLELTDVLKTPLRDNYRLVLKGYSDSSGSPEANMALSVKRARALSELLVVTYYMKMERIVTEGCGSRDPVASNATAEGRALNRRVEIHVYGNVSEAVRFREKQEERQ